MRKLLVAGFMSVGVIMQAQAADADQYAPEMKAYVNFGFGAPAVQSLGLHYGFRMDYDHRLQAALGLTMPSMMQLDFTADHGFSSAQINGQAFLTRTVHLNQDGDPSGSAEGTGTSDGMFSSFTTLDWGLLAAGVVGIGFGIAQVAKKDESPDTTTTSTGGGGGGGGGGGTLCAPGSVPGIGGQCLPL